MTDPKTVYQQVANRIRDLQGCDHGTHGELPLSAAESHELDYLRCAMKCAGFTLNDFEWTA